MTGTQQGLLGGVGDVLVSFSCCNKMPSTGRLKPQTLISPSSGGWKSRLEVLVDSVPRESLFLAVDRWLPALCDLTWQGSGELWSLSSYKDTDLSWGPHLHGLF